MFRAARLRPFTFAFSNGVTIPACALVTVSVPDRDVIFLSNPDDFSMFRFARLCKSEGVKRIRKFAEEWLEMIRPMRIAPSHWQYDYVTLGFDPGLPRRRMFNVHLQRDSSSSPEALKARSNI
jgi:hypothetical protein